WESMGEARWRPVHDHSPAVPTPSGFAIFLEDNILVPRKTAERHANVQRWTVMPRGGHFAPAEEPELLIEDIRAFFRGRH
ncbi:MAG: epoxide hydrolase, partial [Myxococcota bacterium]